MFRPALNLETQQVDLIHIESADLSKYEIIQIVENINNEKSLTLSNQPVQSEPDTRMKWLEASKAMEENSINEAISKNPRGRRKINA